MPKDKYEPPNEKRQHRILQKEEVADGKTTKWSELEIFGCVHNLSSQLWKVQWLTVLYLDNNQLCSLPPQIGRLKSLEHLDASHNFIDSLPAEMGDLVNLRELKLSSNRLRELPRELGKCFQLQTLDLSNNPLNFEVNKYYSEGPTKLLNALMDSIQFCTSLRCYQKEYGQFQSYIRDKIKSASVIANVYRSRICNSIVESF